MKNVLELLERNAAQQPKHLLYCDAGKQLNAEMFLYRVKTVASGLLHGARITGKSGVILMSRGVDALSAAFAINAAGGFYTFLDEEMPSARMRAIIRSLHPAFVITDEDHKRAAEILMWHRVFVLSDLMKIAIDEPMLAKVRADSCSTDTAYVLFTSGSSGTPKGVVVSHGSILAYAEWFTHAFQIRSDDVFAGLSPLFFSMSVTDVYGSLAAGATLYLLSHSEFMFPVQLVETLNQIRATTIYWVPSALGVIANWKILDHIQPHFLRRILFAGERMPVKTLNSLQEALPDIQYANLFGPTETTDICMFYIVDRKYREDESLPIGKPCDNCRCFVLDEQGRQVEGAETGELCIGGPFLAGGYWQDPIRTSMMFCQNPENHDFPDILYHTGDLVRRDGNNLYWYLGRKDNQIKRHGYRIEPGEIETVAETIAGVHRSIAVFKENTDEIVLAYDGRKMPSLLLKEQMLQHLPAYMVPNRFEYHQQLPINANGKIDRRSLQKHPEARKEREENHA